MSGCGVMRSLLLHTHICRFSERLLSETITENLLLSAGLDTCRAIWSLVGPGSVSDVLTKWVTSSWARVRMIHTLELDECGSVDSDWIHKALRSTRCEFVVERRQREHSHVTRLVSHCRRTGA